MTGRLLRALRALALLLVGAATAVAAVALHQKWWGLALGLAATFATLAALPPGWSGRVAFAVGWTGLVTLVVPQRSEGDYLVPGNLAGYLLIGAALVVLLAALVTLPRPRRVPPGDLGAPS